MKYKYTEIKYICICDIIFIIFLALWALRYFDIKSIKNNEIFLFSIEILFCFNIVFIVYIFKILKQIRAKKTYVMKLLSQKDTQILKQNTQISKLCEETSAMSDELYRLIHKIKKNYMATVQAFANAIEAKDKYTRGHCRRVTKYALLIANKMNLSDSDCRTLRIASLLHDIGKIGIPLTIINKKGKLTDDEFKFIKKHPQIGYDILKDIDFLHFSAEIILQHHERIDGTGYPNGLKGIQINRLSKILSIADSFDAMTSSRPYREIPLTINEVNGQFNKNRGTQFDSEIVDVFLDLLNNGEFAM